MGVSDHGGWEDPGTGGCQDPRRLGVLGGNPLRQGTPRGGYPPTGLDPWDEGYPPKAWARGDGRRFSNVMVSEAIAELVQKRSACTIHAAIVGRGLSTS
jgi:hypothetical protein